MLSDEKKTRVENLRQLRAAERLLLQRTRCQRTCFESISALNRAALTMCLAHELDEEDLVALNEVLMIQESLIQAAYAHHLMR
jgi:hypothetical protein